MEQILYRIKKYSEEALHYPAGTFHHEDALRLLGLAIVDYQAAQQSVRRTACTCISFGNDTTHPGVIMGDCPVHGTGSR